MIRGLFFLVLLCLIVAVAAWFADHPGRVAIDWQDWRIETSAAVLVFVVAAVAAVIAALYRLWLFLRRSPRRLRRYGRERRRRRGYEALTRGMVAVAAGDAAEARRQARRADGLLAEPPLTLLLSAQAAQLSGDSGAARRFFTAMLERPETEFLGLRGLMNEAKRSGDTGAALVAARRAHALRPKADWVIEALFELEVRSGEWARAEGVLKEAARRHVFAGPDLARRRAIVLLEQSRAARGDVAEKLAKRALDSDPAFVPAALHYARLLIADRRNRQAQRVLEQSWRVLPTAETGQLYEQATEESDPLQRVKRAEQLAAANPDHVESRIALARAALVARLWGQARRHLAAAADRPDAPRAVYRLFAALEEGEHGDAAKAKAWLAKAADARPDPAWTCARCGSVADDWHPFCGTCDAFDAMVWRSVAAPEGRLPPPIPPRPSGADDAAAVPLPAATGTGAGSRT